MGKNYESHSLPKFYVTADFFTLLVFQSREWKNQNVKSCKIGQIIKIGKQKIAVFTLNSYEMSPGK